MHVNMENTMHGYGHKGRACNREAQKVQFQDIITKRRQNEEDL